MGLKMANETMVTIPLEEYMDLRKRAEENLYLATKLGAFEDRLYRVDDRMGYLESRFDEWQKKNG